MNSVPDAESSRDIPTQIQDQELSPPAANDLLELYDDILTTHDQSNNICDILLPPFLSTLRLVLGWGVKYVDALLGIVH
ncbi:hypothetical protein LTR11_011783, partial [Exophiala xenobiotica]